MFGFRKPLENSDFNNVVICAIGETVRRSGRLPTESELFLNIDELLKRKNNKLSPEQCKSVVNCAYEFSLLSWPSKELIPEYKKFLVEFPIELTSYNNIFKILCMHALLYDDNALDFLGGDLLKQYGLK